MKAALGLCALLICLALPAYPEDDPLGRSRELYQEAMAAYQEGDFPRMLGALEQAVDLRPHHPTLLYKLAAAQALSGETETSVATLGRLAEMGVIVDPASDEDFRQLHELDDFKLVAAGLQKNKTPIGESELAFSFLESRFIPESVAYDPADQSFFVGSVTRGQIIKVRDGAAEPFASGLWSVFGMKVDAGRRLLWICTTACENTQRLGDDEMGRAALLAYDLDSGEVVHTLYPPADDEPYWFGDLCLSEDGEVYVSDSRRGEIYRRLAGSGSLELYLASPRFASLQGLALSDDEQSLFVADYSHGVFKIDIASKAIELLEYPGIATLLGIDGLYVYGGDLIAIQNGIRPHRIVRAHMNADAAGIESVEVLAANDPRWDEPTLGMILGTDFYYVGNSQWNKFDQDGKLPDSVETQEPRVFKLLLGEGPTR